MKIKPPKVMIVDDEPHVVAYLSELFRQIDFEVVDHANDGLEALSKIRLSPPDMLILDITMPGMTGDELVREVKAFDDKIKIVMLTSRNTLDMVKLCKEMGVDGYLLKSEDGRNVMQSIQAIWFDRFFKS